MSSCIRLSEKTSYRIARDERTVRRGGDTLTGTREFNHCLSFVQSHPALGLFVFMLLLREISFLKRLIAIRRMIAKLAGA